MNKIILNPALGKPLHAPMQHYRSERLESYRIIYEIKEAQKEVVFVLLKYRKEAYA